MLYFSSKRNMPHLECNYKWNSWLLLVSDETSLLLVPSLFINNFNKNAWYYVKPRLLNRTVFRYDIIFLICFFMKLHGVLHLVIYLGTSMYNQLIVGM